MKLNPKITSALAWGGLIVVVAVPSAEVLSGGGQQRSFSAQPQQAATTIPVIPTSKPSVQPAAAATRPVLEIDRTAGQAAAPASTVKPAVDPVRTASTSATPAPANGTGSAGAVDRFLSSGKPLPDYISGGSAAAAPSAAASVRPTTTIPTTPATSGDTRVAAIDPQQALRPEVVPFPMPRSLRPADRPDLSALGSTMVPVNQQARAPAQQQPLIIDEARVNQIRQQPVRPVPGAGEQERIVTSDELAGWNSGSLADYLASRGLLSESGGTQRPSPQRPLPPADVGEVEDDYVPGGFWLSERPYRRW
jgi:hypothetical protein